MSEFFYYYHLGLRGVKRELLTALQQCRTNECKQVQQDYEIGRLDENNIHYDKVNLYLFMQLQLSN